MHIVVIGSFLGFRTILELSDCLFLPSEKPSISTDVLFPHTLHCPTFCHRPTGRKRKRTRGLREKVVPEQLRCVTLRVEFDTGKKQTRLIYASAVWLTPPAMHYLIVDSSNAHPSSAPVLVTKKKKQRTLQRNRIDIFLRFFFSPPLLCSLFSQGGVSDWNKNQKSGDQLRFQNGCGECPPPSFSSRRERLCDVISPPERPRIPLSFPRIVLATPLLLRDRTVVVPLLFFFPWAHFIREQE